MTFHKTTIGSFDWQAIAGDLDARGYAITEPVFSSQECALLANSYDEDEQFRKTIVMGKHGFGRGEYKYFSYPLPQKISALREAFYAELVPVANKWQTMSRRDVQFQDDHDAFVERCHKAGQTRPTPLMLRYGKDDYNCLHQDLYGEHVFPLQVAIMLSSPHRDFSGGEFILTEQRPRMQSRAEVVSLEQGEAVIFAVNERPVQGTKGAYRVRMRHGVSSVKNGQRHVLGIIFHDAI